MSWFIAFFCLVIGAVIGWLLSDRRWATLRAEAKVSAQRLADQQKLLDQAESKLRDAFANLSSERMGLAVPVIVGGRAVAVVYADSVALHAHDHQSPSGWPEVVEVLARHAARCLEALTVQKTVNAATPRFWMQAANRPGATA